MSLFGEDSSEKELALRQVFQFRADNFGETDTTYVVATSMSKALEWLNKNAIVPNCLTKIGKGYIVGEDT